MNNKHLNLLLASLCLSVFVSACSSNIPLEISEPVEASPELSQVRANPEAFLSQKLRWGGVILSSENRENTSRLVIVAFPLNGKTRPRIDRTSPGRFIAIVDEFLEPLVYSSEREITLIGKLVGTEVSKVGEFDYEYPLVEVDSFYLWRPRPKTVDYNPPYYRPYYNPYYPFYPWPYYRPHWHH